MRAILFVVLCSPLLGAPLQPVADVLVDVYGGRHPSLVIGKDKLPFIVYLSDGFGSVGVGHCEDALCKRFSRWYLDRSMPGAGNQISLKVNPVTGYPQFAYSLNVSCVYSIVVVTCYDVECLSPDTVTAQVLPNHNPNNLYLDLSYDPATGRPLISFNNDPSGLYLLRCFSLNCSHPSPPLPIDTRSPYTGWYSHISFLGDNTTLLVTYYSNTTFEVLYASVELLTLTEVTYGVIAPAHGGWVSAAELPTGLSLTYVDLSSNGTYHYCECKAVPGSFPTVLEPCQCTQIDENLGSGYDLWVYPDVALQSSFSPYPCSSYFHYDELKIAQCESDACVSPEIQTVSQGKFGYGRDSKMVWDSHLGMLYVPFLDYNGDGVDKKCRLTILQKPNVIH